VTGFFGDEIRFRTNESVISELLLLMLHDQNGPESLSARTGHPHRDGGPGRLFDHLTQQRFDPLAIDSEVVIDEENHNPPRPNQRQDENRP